MLENTNYSEVINYTFHNKKRKISTYEIFFHKIYLHSALTYIPVNFVVTSLLLISIKTHCCPKKLGDTKSSGSVCGNPV